MLFRPLVFLIAPALYAAAPSPLDRQFDQTVRPFVAKYCVGCHSGKTPASGFDLKSFNTTADVARDFSHWALVAQRIGAGEMPPKPLPAPPAADRQKVIAWVAAMRADEVRKNPGDPGPVLGRRLSNAEYDYTMRDLTGRDFRPAREFPVDPANTAGFDNSGESLTMSPALLNKYLAAARSIADHMYLTPDDFAFAPYPMLVETDRDKFAIQEILDFYAAQPTDFADYFAAAWRFEHRAAMGHPTATLASIAAESKVSAKYLPMVWDLLEHDKDPVGPIAKLQSMFRALPAPAGAKEPAGLRGKCVVMRDFVVKIRQDTAMQFMSPVVRGLPPMSQPLATWKMRQFASHRRNSDPNDLRNDDDPPPVLPEIPKYPGLHQEAGPRWAALTARARATDDDLIVPHAERVRYEAAFERFANVFPDAFYWKERGRYFPDDSQDKGRFLSAGFHNVMGYFRDDTPLSELILDEKGQKKLNDLWNEFDYLAAYTERTWVQFWTNQSGAVDGKGAESGTLLPADHPVTDKVSIERMREKYLAKAAANPNNSPLAPQAIREHFDRVNATLRDLERQHDESVAKHMEALDRFAARAYRRPLTQSEKDDLAAYYRSLREKNSMSHEDAMRNLVVSVLMSPDFLYRIDLVDAGMGSAAAAKMAAGREALSTYAVASRLSYFLWSSMPDSELLKHAASGDLHDPNVLQAEVRRMLKDAKSDGLATEFAGNWLDFRRFETNNNVDRQRFPDFTDDLREAMFQEPIHFIGDMIRNDRSILNLIYGDYTFVNPALADHYDMFSVDAQDNEWVRVDHASDYGRGGIIPMAVFLTQNSPGLRTSPVKRGYWVVHRVLGQVIPPPPPVVPELPADESKSDLPLREKLAQHRSNPVCAACHAKFDSFGLAFEGFGPTGEHRAKDLGGRPVDTMVTFPTGSTGEGLEAVKTYIKEHRQDDFVDTFCRRLLAFALNRSLQFSDEGLVERMKSRGAANQYRFETLVETIASSPQFLYKKEESHEAEAIPPGR